MRQNKKLEQLRDSGRSKVALAAAAGRVEPFKLRPVGGSFRRAALAERRLLRMELIGERIVRVEELFGELDARLRNVEMGPDAALYVLTDAGDGRLLKIEPAALE